MIKGVFVVLTVLGLAMAAFGVYFILYSNEATSWSSVEGRIVNTMVRTHTTSTPSTAATAAARERLRTYYPSVTYRWTVDGQSYQGSRYSLGQEQDDFPEREDAERAATAFPAGSAIEVFYDPADPASAVLSRSRQAGAFVPLPLGLLILLTGVVGLKYSGRIAAATPDASFDVN